MKAVKAFALVLALGLTACISGKAPETTYTSPTTGETTVIESNVEMCTHSCNDDYSRCMETEQADQNLPGVPQTTPGVAPGILGASGDCRRELSECLPRCKSQ